MVIIKKKIKKRCAIAIYEFECKKCKHKYDELVSYDPTGKYSGVRCPECKSKSKIKLMPSSFQFNFTNPEGTDRWNNGSTGHDYRFKTNLPKVLKERKNAELASHMGSDPYKDTSEKDIKLDTGIHDAESRGGLS
jgi:DNA-directed RNA polymerase subunit RPC12/RpoP